MNISDIKKEANYMYEGYLWLSDSGKPIVLDGKKTLEEVLNEKKQTKVLDEGANPFIKGANPFIIEGFLYHRKDDNNKDDKTKSYTIKYVDGESKVFQFDVPDNIPKKDVKEYYANRMDDKAILWFWDKWTEDQDPLCEGMEVLQPKAKIFIGFENLKEKEN